MSVALILSMIFSMSAQASVVQIKPVNVNLDMESASTVTVSASAPGTLTLDGKGSKALSVVRRGGNSIVPSFEGYNNVLAQKNASGKTLYIDFQVLDETGAVTSIANGQYHINAKFYTPKELSRSTWEFYSSNGSKNSNIKDLHSSMLPGIWYDVEVKLDLDENENNLTAVFKPELSAASSSEVSSYTVSKTTTYDLGDFNKIRVMMSPPVDDSGITACAYWANIKMVHYPSPYTKASIEEIGSDGETNSNQKNITVKLSDNIPEFKKEYVSIEKQDGGDIAISSAAISSDGSDYYLNITTTNNLPAWTEYILTISPEAWGTGSIQVEGGIEKDVTAISGEFYTPADDFDMKDPLFTLSDGDANIICADTKIANIIGGSKEITLVFAIYDSDGRIKGIYPTSFTQGQTGNQGDVVHVEAPISSGDTAKLMAINGWENKTPLFKEFSAISYEQAEQN